MAVKIRLARGGSKKRPFYRIVAADARAPRDGAFIEKLGTYNPLLAKDDANRISYDKERMQHWLSTGAVPSERVQRFLFADGLIEKPRFFDNPKRKPKNAPEEEEATAEAPAEGGEEAATEEAA